MFPHRVISLRYIPVQIFAGWYCTGSPTWATASGLKRHREGGRWGVSRQLNHWHGEPALKRVHASLHNYPLCIETTSIIKDADSGLIGTSKNGSWSVTEHRVRGQSATSLGWLRFISTLILFVKFKMNECVTNILKGSLKISMAHQWMSAGIVHGVWDHRRIMKIHAHVALPGLFPFSGYVGVLAVVLKTNDNSPWTDEFDSKGDQVKSLHTNCKKGVLRLISLYLCPTEIELSCLIESISTTNPRIEWKKITNEGPSYVYFEKKISGNRSHLWLFHCIDDTLNLYYFLFQ